MQEGNALHVQCAVSLCHSFFFFSFCHSLWWLKPYQWEREHQTGRQKADVGDRNIHIYIYIFFIVRVPNVDRQSKASDVQSFLEAPREISKLGCQCTPRHTQHSDKGLLQAGCIELLAARCLALCTCLDGKMFGMILNQI